MPLRSGLFRAAAFGSLPSSRARCTSGPLDFARYSRHAHHLLLRCCMPHVQPSAVDLQGCLPIRKAALFRCACCVFPASCFRRLGSPSTCLSPPLLWAPAAPLSDLLRVSRLCPKRRTAHALEGHADSGWLPPSVHAPEAGLQTLPDAPGGNAGNELIFPALNDCI